MKPTQFIYAAKTSDLKALTIDVFLCYLNILALVLNTKLKLTHS